jgi:hypothetical protein
MYNVTHCPEGVGHSVRDCVVKALYDVAGTKNPIILRVCVA